MKATTNITCNNCKYLKVVRRKIKLSNRTDRNTWVLFCKHPEFNNMIDVIDVRNKDPHSASMPEIKAPFQCHKRQAKRMSEIESKFELQIN